MIFLSEPFIVKEIGGNTKDYIIGMWLILQQKNPKDYVLAIGKTYTIKDFVNRAF